MNRSTPHGMRHARRHRALSLACNPRTDMYFVVLVLLLHVTDVTAQTTFMVENFEFATSDAAAAAGVVDLTDFANRPAFYISGDGEGASPAEPGGQFSIGTDAAFCVQFCQPGSVIGFRRYLSASDFPSVCPNSNRHYAPLQFTYGDPQHPGDEAPDFPLSTLGLLNDVYGDGAFCDGLSWTNYWVSLVDCEGEIYEFVNIGEVSMCSIAWTLDLAMGSSFKRLSPKSLIDVPQGDRLLTEIMAIEVFIQDENDPPVALGKWYIDHLRAVEPPAPAVPGDWDENGQVDLGDYAALGACLQGPGVVVGASCAPFLMDADTDVDLGDIQLFFAGFGAGS